MKRFISFSCLVFFITAIFLLVVGFEAKISQNWEKSSISFSHSFICFTVFFVLRWISNFIVDLKEK